MTTYDLTSGVPRDFEEFIYLLSPVDVPLQGTYNDPNGTPNPGRIAKDEPYMEKKIEWQDEELLTPRSALAATLVTADTFLTVTSGEREKFSTGDLVLIDDEYIRITGYGTTADTLTITKNWNTTGTSAQHSNLSTIVGVGTTLNEGADPENARAKDRVERFNLTEIFGPYAIVVSGSERSIQKYGVADEFIKQRDNRLKELFIAIDQTLLYGVRSTDDTNKRRAMGGLDFFITTNKDTTTTDLTETKLLDQLQNTYDNGGVVDLLITGAAQKRKISGIAAAQVRLQRSERIRGQVVDTYESDFGSADVLLDRWVRKADLFGLSSEYVSYGYLSGRQPQFQPIAKTGDADKGQVLAEPSMKVRLEKRHFKFKALQ
jgi:hypothetical protein